MPLKRDNNYLKKLVSFLPAFHGSKFHILNNGNNNSMAFALKKFGVSPVLRSCSYEK